jgi:hypothetical protein
MRRLPATVDLRAAVKRLRRFGDLMPDWDSYGAQPISHRAIDAGISLVVEVQEQLGGTLGDAIEPYNIIPVAHGGVGIEWRGAGGELTVEITSDGELGFLLVDSDDAGEHISEADNVSEVEIIRLVSQILTSTTSAT